LIDEIYFGELGKNLGRWIQMWEIRRRSNDARVELRGGRILMGAEDPVYAGLSEADGQFLDRLDEIFVRDLGEVVDLVGEAIQTAGFSDGDRHRLPPVN
jgi:hypothetical protein